MPEVCDPITQNGSHYIKWIHMLFGSCVYGNREAASLLLGFLSIACWLNAQSPQVITNYKNKSTDGVSIQFLMILLLGDVTNLVGCLLTKQLPFQTYLSMYFCSMDCALFLQYFYYTWSSSSINGDDDCEERKELEPISKTSRTSSIRSSNSLIIGRVISWMCTTLYLTSRMPQIWQNHQRKSVEGLSIVMFIFAALGNLTYTMSIFTNPLASSDPLFLIDKIPYILGSVGTLSFDVTIFLQWCVWKDRIRNDHQYPYRRARSATTHSYSSIGLSSSKRLSSSTHKLGYNTLPSNYHKTNFKKQLRSGAGSNDDIRRSIILTNGELFV
ncbi:5164_t:CDS:2 [Entrophospora sp. SA101]|nr:5164_t:CDS:2 [Entrophospora sp. SA101]